MMCGRRTGVIFLAGWLALAGGCGDNPGKRGGKFVYPQEAPEPSSTAAAKPSDVKPPQGGAAPAGAHRTAAPAAAAGAAAAAGETSTAARVVAGVVSYVKRPALVSEWKQADYLSAKMESDPRLLEAINALGAQSGGSPEAAQILTSVLARTSLPAKDGKLDPAWEPAAILALAANGSGVARTTLSQLLLHEYPTDDDTLAFNTTVQVLVSQPTPEGLAILFDALRQPKSWGLRNGVADINAPGPRMLAALRPVAPEALRVRMAEAVRNGKLEPPLEDAVVAFLSDELDVNLAPQCVLYSWRNLPPATREKFEDHFVDFVSLGMRQLLLSCGDPSGVPDGGARPGDVAATLSGTAPRLVSVVNRSLWDANVSTLCDQLLRIDGLERQWRPVALGLMVPRDSVREALAEALKGHRLEGPLPLVNGMANRKGCLDPGALLVLKSLYHHVSTAPKLKHNATTPRTAAGRLFKEGMVDEVRINQQWTQFTYQAVVGLCEVFNVASTPVRPASNDSRSAETRGKRGTRSPSGEDDVLPIDLHGQAHLLSRYDLHWPRDAVAREGVHVDPLVVHYVRAYQNTSDARATVAYYRDQLSSPMEILQEKGKRLWLDGRPRAGSPGHKLSVDVLLTRSRLGPPPAGGEEERITVEVLAVEVKDVAPLTKEVAAGE